MQNGALPSPLPEKMTERSHNPTTEESAPFLAFAAATRVVVERALEASVTRRREAARALGPADAEALVDAVASLSLRGGKRLRAVLVAAAYVAAGGEGGAERIAPALVAMELLQTYLLIHDDWMDQDEVRRGGPTVHASLRGTFGSARAGEVGAILAGDLAAAFALEELASCPMRGASASEALLAFGKMQSTVVLGQLLDVRGTGRDPAGVEQVHDMKTASYTVRGPVAVGAILAGAPVPLREALDAFARPLGIAFQLRDDLLGTFGDPGVTGKASRSDLRQGKRTALVAELLARGGDDAEAAERLLAAPEAASDDELDAIADRMVASGARARVEARLTELLDESRAALDRAALSREARNLLVGAIHVLGRREA